MELCGFWTKHCHVLGLNATAVLMSECISLISLIWWTGDQEDIQQTTPHRQALKSSGIEPRTLLQRGRRVDSYSIPRAVKEAIVWESWGVPDQAARAQSPIRRNVAGGVQPQSQTKVVMMEPPTEEHWLPLWRRFIYVDTTHKQVIGTVYGKE